MLNKPKDKLKKLEQSFPIDQRQTKPFFSNQQEKKVQRRAKMKQKMRGESWSRKTKTSQELRMLSRSLSDCKSLLLNVIIQVSQFVSNSQQCH